MMQRTREAAAEPAAQQMTQYELDLRAIDDYRRFAALTIQRVYRGWSVRLRRAREEAARQQQQLATAQAAAVRQHRAARAIQDAWRAHHSRRVFRLYRDLICFRERCAAHVVLRSINAPEAALVEPAAGLHIRLRLAGACWPPVLVYKVFTHRPVADIGAFGPRDYAAEAAAARAAAPATAAAAPACRRHATTTASSRHAQASCQHGGTPGGWYRRDDRNGWRPVVQLQQLPGEAAWSGPPLCAVSIATQQHAAHSSAARAPLRLHRGRGCTHGGSSGGSRRARTRRWMPVGRRCSRFGGSRCAGGADVAAGAGAGSCNGISSDQLSSAQQPCLHHSKEGSGSAEQRRAFHHSPLVRRAERAQRLKQRRRQWLLKMYALGMQAQQRGGCAHAASSEPPGGSAGGVDGVQAATAAAPPGAQQQQQQQQQPAGQGQCDEELLLQKLEQQLLLQRQPGGLQGDRVAHNTAGGAAGGDGDDDDAAWLHAWACRLDFEAYHAQWLRTAATLGSDAGVPSSEQQQLAAPRE